VTLEANNPARLCWQPPCLHGSRRVRAIDRRLDMKSGKKNESMTFNGPAIVAVFRW
jgi:hypothetical protein